MAEPVGEDGWLAYLDEASRTATDLDGRIAVVEEYNKRAIASEPWSLKLWLAYCEWFWSLHTDCQTGDAGWPEEEQVLGQELFSLSEALKRWEEGYEAVQYRLSDSHELWNRWISIELEELSKARTRDNIERVRSVFLQRLQTPHGSWDETSQKFSAFLTEYDEASYESTMVEATKLSELSKQLYSLRESHELKLHRATESGDSETQQYAMKDYLDWECKQARIKKKGKPAGSPEILCIALFERALCSAVLGQDPELWQDYIAWIDQFRVAQEPDITTIYQRATNHCPFSGTLWARYILAAEAKGFEHHVIEMIKHSATNANLDRDGMASVVEVYIAWCGYLSRRASVAGAPEEYVDLADMGLPTALEDVRTWGQKLHGKQYKGDPLFRIERIMIQYLTLKRQLSNARGYWKNLVKTHANSYEFWQQYYFWEMTVRPPTPPLTMATDVLIQSISHRTLDWPEKMMEIYVRHATIYADAATLITALNTVRSLSKPLTKRRADEAAAQAAAYAQQQPVAAETAVGESPGTSKRKREATPEQDEGNFAKKIKSVEQVPEDPAASRDQHLARDRENTTVLVTNIPHEATQTKIRQYFKDYGHINNLTVKPEADKSLTALIEFRSHEDAQSALLRDGKYFTIVIGKEPDQKQVQRQIHVVSATGFTLYLTNYPRSADDKFFEDLFKECGEVFNIRWPSLKFNVTRRFCYITFRTYEAAAAATKLDGQMREGHRLSVMYSDPSRKKPREGAIEEGREVHITSIDHALNERDLKDVFSKYGEVETVRLLRNFAGESKGAAFVVFKKKEDAISALDLDNTKVKSKVIRVEISIPKNYKPIAFSKGTLTSPAPDGDTVMSQSPAPDTPTDSHATSNKEHSNCTVIVMNVPDTVNDARITALAEKYGTIVKVVLRPDHQGAIIEYTNSSSARKALLGLENQELAGRRLRTGGMKDLFRQKEEIKTDRIPVGQGKKTPTTGFIQPGAPVRRPGGRGGLGTKRGLGYSALKPTPNTETLNANETNEKKNDGGGTPKSNADFKALFLSGGKQ